MSKFRAEKFVYRDFYTNVAVAWFSAAVIAPLFTKQVAFKDLIASTVSMIFCLIFLRLAVIANKELKDEF